jgi:dTDP-4-dehydrorhamnose reductase
MLGHVVARLFSERGYAVCTSEQRFDGRPDGPFFLELRAAGCDVIVNCIAAARGAGAQELLLTNGLLPQMLAALSAPALLIHASSDAVFSGQRGNYGAAELPDALDGYGLSKRLGERCLELTRAVVLRVSVIGPEPTGGARNLLSWYLAQQQGVRGYTDVRWNGITSLQWARAALLAAEGRLAPGIHQPASPDVLSKAALLAEIRSAFARGAAIEPVASGTAIDRSLRPSCEVPPISQQLRELAEWYGRAG